MRRYRSEQLLREERLAYRKVWKSSLKKETIADKMWRVVKFDFFGETWSVLEFNLVEDIVKDIEKTVFKINQNLRKSITCIDLIKHHSPMCIEDYQHILECVKREYEYQKTMNHWNYMRNLKGSNGEARGFRFRYFIKDYRIQPDIDNYDWTVEEIERGYGSL